MKYISLTACLLFALHTYGQTEASVQPNDSIYTYVEQMPEPGYDMSVYLRKHLHYPDFAANKNIQGRVILKFVVNEDGSISNCRVEKGIGGGCDEEALNVIKNMPNWKAGLLNGQPVKVSTMLPVSFTLTKKEPIYNTAIDRMERLPKPDYDFDKYVTEHLKYPRSAWDKRIEGKATMLCLIEKDGSVSDIFLQESLDFDCDEEAKDLIKKMPNWLPGINKGEAVRTLTPIDVSFVWSDKSRISDTLKVAKERPPSSGFDLPGYLMKTLHYPIYARDHNIQGRVIVKFVINEDGHISNPVVVRGIGGGCDEEALRVVSEMPPWKPGMQQGKAVKVSFTLPVQFKLE